MKILIMIISKDVWETNMFVVTEVAIEVSVIIFRINSVFWIKAEGASKLISDRNQYLSFSAVATILQT